ncbi:MAG: hypothetical protein GEV11_22420 [Streptosporangiales bacterium]|nr:hypothetical protein [Streptosporangiales bacterium]
MGAPGGPPRPQYPGRPPGPPGPYGYGRAPLGPPRKKGAGPGVWIAGIFGGLAVCLIVLVGLASAFTEDDPSDPYAGPTSSAGPTDGPSEEPTGGPSPSATPTQPTGRTAVTDSKLYDTGRLATVPCRAPSLSIRSTSSMRRFLNTSTDCLDEMWGQQFQKAGMTFEPPDRIYWSGPGRSPCGSFPAPGAAAFYCRASKGMYIGVRDVVKNSANAPYPVVYASVLSHEYGHHVQGEAGILDYGHEKMYYAGSIDEKNGYSRRIELQANCMAGVFMSSVRGTYPIGSDQRRIALLDAYYRGDRGPESTHDHGSRTNGRAWLNRGMTLGGPSACNTWSVSASKVD